MLTVRTEITNWTLIFDDHHLRSVLAKYQAYYNRRDPMAAARSDPAADPSQERVKSRAVLCGLINEHERTAWKPWSKMVAEILAPHRVKQHRSPLGRRS
jgi:hypothetical protein